MSQEQKGSVIAILGILIIGWCYQNGYIEQKIGALFSILIFVLSQLYSIYQKKQKNENWMKNVVISILFLSIMIVLLLM